MTNKEKNCNESSAETLNQADIHLDKKFNQYRVVQGFKKFGSGYLVVSGNTVSNLGVTENTKVIAFKEGDKKPQSFFCKVKSGLKDDVVAIMEKDRNALGVELGDFIFLSEDVQENFDDYNKIKLIVQKGEKEDKDFPPTIRINKQLIKILGLRGEYNAYISHNKDSKKVQIKVLESRRRLAKNQAAIRKKLREKLEVNTDKAVLLWIPRKAKLATDLIEIGMEDIVKLDVDAIVNSTNEKLVAGQGLDAAIHKAAGPKLKTTLKKLKGCKTGEAKITEGFNLPAKYIIHTVGPRWKDGENNEDKLLANCYRNSLRLAIGKRHKYNSFSVYFYWNIWISS